jgi:hypothetical protein
MSSTFPFSGKERPPDLGNAGGLRVAFFRVLRVDRASRFWGAGVDPTSRYDPFRVDRASRFRIEDLAHPVTRAVS